MTRIFLIIKLAFVGILTNKMRSFLSVLGIFIGIASVIALLSLGEGAQKEVVNTVSSLGTDIVTVIPGNIAEEAQSGRPGPPGTTNSDNASLTERDLLFLSNQSRFPYIKTITPIIEGTKTLKKGSAELNSSVTGVNQDLQDIQMMIITDGRFFRKSDIENKRNTAIIGTDIVSELFPKSDNSDVIGEYLLIDNIKFEIIGVLEPQESSGFTNPNEIVYIPYTTAGSKIFGSTDFGRLQFNVTNSELINATVNQINEKLSKYRNVDPEEADFTIFTSEDLLNTASEVIGIFTVLLSSIAAISLVVGGIGISNIMIASVTERTKEIGLRIALGAKQRDILLQFLIEGILLTFVGGVIGIILGILIAVVAGNLTGITASITLNNIVLATAVSVAVGVIFGFFPALKASRMDPIEALRYE